MRERIRAPLRYATLRNAYQNERGAKICEYLRLNAEGKIIQGSANHLAH